MAGRVVLFRVDEQAPAEQVVPCCLGGHFDREVVRGVRTYMNVGHKTLALAQIGFNAVPQGIELVGRELAIDRAPGDGSLSGWLFNDVTINRRTAGTVTGLHDQRASIGKYAFTAIQGFFNQIIDAQIGVNGVISLRHEVPRRPLAECSKRFVVEIPTLLQRKKWAGLCQKHRK